jgi:hypothetical protein
LHSLSQPARVAPKARFLSIRRSQDVVQDRAEIGLNDVEFTLSDGNGLRKIVHNLQACFNDRERRTSTRLNIATVSQTRATLNVCLIGQAGDAPT